MTGRAWTLRSLIPLSPMTSLVSGSLWRNRVTNPPLRLLGTLSESCLKGIAWSSLCVLGPQTRMGVIIISFTPGAHTCLLLSSLAWPFLPLESL